MVMSRGSLKGWLPNVSRKGLYSIVQICQVGRSLILVLLMYNLSLDREFLLCNCLKMFLLLYFQLHSYRIESPH